MASLKRLLNTRAGIEMCYWSVFRIHVHMFTHSLDPTFLYLGSLYVTHHTNPHRLAQNETLVCVKMLKLVLSGYILLLFKFNGVKITRACLYDVPYNNIHNYVV